jgi:predicted acetyltransferase
MRVPGPGDQGTFERVSPDIRVLTSTEDLQRSAEVFYSALIAFPPPPRAQVPEYLEPGRTLGAFDGEAMVGTATSMTSRLEVPGGARVPHAMVTDVGVLGTHKRRGIASALVGAQLRDAAGRGELVASLRASEATIYERFGFGVASWVCSIELDSSQGGLRDTVPTGGPVRLVSQEESWEPAIRISAADSGTGRIDRPEYWWRGARLSTADQKPVYTVLHGAPGAEDGTVTYRPVNTDLWFSQPNRTVDVVDLVATTPQARFGLLRYLLELDLVRTVRIRTAPVDHGLALMFTDARAVRTTGIRDETWLRLLDVERALDARTYTGERSVVLEVHDRLLTSNSGRYRIGSDGVKRTDANADLSLDVGALSAIYLGGSPVRQLAAAGRLGVHRPDAVADAEELFATGPAPFCGTMF